MHTTESGVSDSPVCMGEEDVREITRKSWPRAPNPRRYSGARILSVRKIMTLQESACVSFRTSAEQEKGGVRSRADDHAREHARKASQTLPPRRERDTGRARRPDWARTAKSLYTTDLRRGQQGSPERATKLNQTTYDHTLSSSPCAPKSHCGGASISFSARPSPRTSGPRVRIMHACMYACTVQRSMRERTLTRRAARRG